MRGPLTGTIIIPSAGMFKPPLSRPWLRATTQKSLLPNPSRIFVRGFSSELDKLQNGRERVVILGSGWGGFTLGRSLDRKKFQVIMVSPRSYFVFTPLLASTSVGTLEFRTALEPIRSKRSETNYLQGWADKVDFQNKKITIEESVSDPRQGLVPLPYPHEGESSGDIQEDGKEKPKRGPMVDLNYDKLVISVGCYTQTFGIPGVKEHANFLKDVGDARKIRKALLERFEAAALPDMPESIRKQLLHFITVGGGPTGIEFSAELHDLITEDMTKLYPDIAKYARVTVCDVAPQVLSSFDQGLAKYAMETFKREGIAIKTSCTVEKLTAGLPNCTKEGDSKGVTMHIKGEEPIGCGMVVWNTGLMQNPFIQKAFSEARPFPPKQVIYRSDLDEAKAHDWTISKHEKTGSIYTSDRLRVILEAKSSQGEPLKAYTRDVFAIGDCGVVEGTAYPPTAQVASQKALWLAKRLNKNDLHQNRFKFKNMGVMAYIGKARAILGTAGFGNISGRAAWLAWRSAYLAKSVSWRNRILITVHWFTNWAFGRDISRF